jgi:peptidoglycan/xylan/chitin deacetylase (PgdA/CDA1 family)
LLRKYIWPTADLIGLPWLSRQWHRRHVLIVMYHAVIEGARPYTKWTHLPLAQFEWQIRYLKHHYQVMPLGEVIGAMREGRRLPDHVAVITFDDGYRNNYTTAFPVLRNAEAPATIFLATGFLDSGSKNWPDRVFLAIHGCTTCQLDLRDFDFDHFRFNTPSERNTVLRQLLAWLKQLPVSTKNEALAALEARLAVPAERLSEIDADFAPLSWDEVATMASSGLIDFGAHTIQHEIVSRLEPDEMRREIFGSCDVVRQRLGCEEVAFAYPNGARADFNELSKQMLREAGALCGLSTIPGLCQTGDDRYELKRIPIGSDLTSSSFVAQTSGLVSGLKQALGKP